MVRFSGPEIVKKIGIIQHSSNFYFFCPNGKFSLTIKNVPGRFDHYFFWGVVLETLYNTLGKRKLCYEFFFKYIKFPLTMSSDENE